MENPKYLKLNDIDAYKVNYHLSNYIWNIIVKWEHFPKHTIGIQFVTAADSISANIAEGYGRFHYLDNIKFCRDARGSLNETLDHLTVAFDEKYINEERLIQLNQQFEKVLKLLNGYIGYLKQQKTL